MIVVLAAKVSVLRESTGESMLRRAGHQLVAAHLCVMMRRCRCSRCAVRAGRMRRGRVMMMRALAHATCSAGRGAGSRTVAGHGAERTEAKWCRRIASGHTGDSTQTRSAAVHGRQARSPRAARMFAQSCPAIGEPYLYACLGEARRLCQLLAGIHIRVLGAGKGALQRLQLLRREGSARSTLFAFQGNTRLRFGVTDVRVAACKRERERERDTG